MSPKYVQYLFLGDWDSWIYEILHFIIPTQLEYMQTYVHFPTLIPNGQGNNRQVWNILLNANQAIFGQVQKFKTLIKS